MMTTTMTPRDKIHHSSNVVDMSVVDRRITRAVVRVGLMYCMGWVLPPYTCPILHPYRNPHRPLHVDRWNDGGAMPLPFIHDPRGHPNDDGPVSNEGNSNRKIHWRPSRFMTPISILPIITTPNRIYPLTIPMMITISTMMIWWVRKMKVVVDMGISPIRAMQVLLVPLDTRVMPHQNIPTPGPCRVVNDPNVGTVVLSPMGMIWPLWMVVPCSMEVSWPWPIAVTTISICTRPMTTTMTKKMIPIHYSIAQNAGVNRWIIPNQPCILFLLLPIPMPPLLPNPRLQHPWVRNVWPPPISITWRIKRTWNGAGWRKKTSHRQRKVSYMVPHLMEQEWVHHHCPPQQMLLVWSVRTMYHSRYHMVRTCPPPWHIRPPRRLPQHWNHGWRLRHHRWWRPIVHHPLWYRMRHRQKKIYGPMSNICYGLINSVGTMPLPCHRPDNKIPNRMSYEPIIHTLWIIIWLIPTKVLVVVVVVNGPGWIRMRTMNRRTGRTCIPIRW